jgi:hypothetical protein
MGSRSGTATAGHARFCTPAPFLLPPRSPTGLSWPITMSPNVWTAMGHVIVTGPSTPRQTGPRLRLPGLPRAPQCPHATQSHPEAATATPLPFLTPHDAPKRVDCHGQTYCYRFPHTPTNGTTAAAAATGSPYKPSCRQGQFSRKVPLDSFSVFSTNRIFFLFSTYHYLRRRLRRLINFE